VDAVNVSRSRQVVSLIKEAAGGIEGKRVTVWGATFKAGTDDVRESSGLLVADQLHSLGATVTVYDPTGSGNALAAFPELTYADSAIVAAADADVIAVVTAWPEFTQVDAREVAGVVGGRVIVDACQGISVTAWRGAGWEVSSLTGLRARQWQDDAAAVAG
jgi:UDPglucose 6-dehydrogenase